MSQKDSGAGAVGRPLSGCRLRGQAPGGHMKHVSAGEATLNGVRSRRRRMRDQARSRHAGPATGSDHYQTPEWLERSFVLPLTQPEASEVPSQPVRRHDDDPDHSPEAGVTAREALPAATFGPALVPGPSFVRPPSEDIDFARVVRRADLCRQVTRLHWIATGLAGLALVIYLLVSSAWVLDLVVVCAVVAVVAFAVRLRLSRAPVPRLQR